MPESRLKRRLLILKSENNDLLKTLFWETTLRCNARCAFCGSGCGENTHYPDELTTEEICHVLQDTAQKLPAAGIMLNITGGEPLLRKDVFAVAGFAASLGYPWGMVTNGSLLNGKVIREMKENGLKTLTVSIDGLKRTHEELRRLAGSYDRMIGNLKEIAEDGFADHLQVTTVVNRKNIGELEQLRELLLTIGLDSWRVVTVDPIGRANENKDILLNPDEMRQYFEFIEKYCQDPVLPVLQSCSHYFGDREPRLRSRSFSCRAGKTVASVLYNGDIFVCPNVQRRKELIQGNVRRDSLAEVWQKGFSFFRKKDRTLSDKCRNCYYREECGGDSLHTWNFEEQQPAFCIRNYDDDKQKATYSAKKQLYDNTVEAYKTTVRQPRLLRQYTDRPSRSRVILTKQAYKELTELFEWGQDTPHNRIEQMACLLGRREDTLLVIQQIRQISLAYADETAAVFTEDSLKEGWTALNQVKEEGKDAELLGFVHSHPRELKTELSVSDERLHRYLTERYSVPLTMLVNPQKKIIKAFYDTDFDLSEVRILLPDEQSE